MAIEEAIYRSFLLRLWQVEQNGTLTWRCSLEEVATDKRRLFIDLEEMLVFLRSEIVELPQSRKNE
ncbi:hypothetical protein [Candidatus Leptofilum sp.]|uniref:hypothetical protein n=1 Tax=Candidatus Leptofilum sp. TaxID=3241576 RepID=UPI003B5AE940